jgi:biopolymer transport protein ExbD
MRVKPIHPVLKFVLQLLLLTCGIWMFSNPYDGIRGFMGLLWFMAIWGLAGWLLRIGLVRITAQVSSANALAIFPGMPRQNSIRWVRHAPLPVFWQPPQFSLICGSILFVVMICFMILQPRTPQGLYLKLAGPPKAELEKHAWPATLSVYVDECEQFHVNGELIKREDLATGLQKKLARQASWTVYFEASNDALFMDAAYAMDTIKGLGANVIWITPAMREEWKPKGWTLTDPWPHPASGPIRARNRGKTYPFPPPLACTGDKKDAGCTYNWDKN